MSVFLSLYLLPYLPVINNSTQVVKKHTGSFNEIESI